MKSYPPVNRHGRSTITIPIISINRSRNGPKKKTQWKHACTICTPVQVTPCTPKTKKKNNNNKRKRKKKKEKKKKRKKEKEKKKKRKRKKKETKKPIRNQTRRPPKTHT
jgi:hypothetical protein